VVHANLAYKLRDRKLQSLAPLEPQTIILANIGCIQHLQTGTTAPVKHWIEDRNAGRGASMNLACGCDAALHRPLPWCSV
jgi:hypothetical protein